MKKTTLLIILIITAFVVNCQTTTVNGSTVLLTNGKNKAKIVINTDNKTNKYGVLTNIDTNGTVNYQYPEQYDVRLFGVKGDSVTNDRSAMTRAVNFIDSIGGGTLYIAKGLKVGVDTPVYWKSKVNLHLEGLFFNRRKPVDESEQSKQFSVINLGNYEPNIYDTTNQWYKGADSIKANVIYLKKPTDIDSFKVGDMVILRGKDAWLNSKGNSFKPFYQTFAIIDSIIAPNIIVTDNPIDSNQIGGFIGKVGNIKPTAVKNKDENDTIYYGIHDVDIYGSGTMLSYGGPVFLRATGYRVKIDGITVIGTEGIGGNMMVRWRVNNVTNISNKQGSEFAINSNNSIFSNIKYICTGSTFKRAKQPFIRFGENSYHNILSNININLQRGGDSLSIVAFDDAWGNTIDGIYVIGDSVRNGIEFNVGHDSAHVYNNVVKNGNISVGKGNSFTFVQFVQNELTYEQNYVILKDNIVQNIHFEGEPKNNAIECDGENNAVINSYIPNGAIVAGNPNIKSFLIRDCFLPDSMLFINKPNLKMVNNRSKTYISPYIYYDTANVGYGFKSLYNNNGQMSGNVAIGDSTLFSLVNTNNNTAIGSKSLHASTAASNTSVGAYSQYLNTTGQFNTATGTSSLYSNLTGSKNTAFGKDALKLTTGSSNIAIGANAGDNNITGNSNIVIGTDIWVPGGTSANNTLNIGNALFATGINDRIDDNPNNSTTFSIGKFPPQASLDVRGTALFNSSASATVEPSAQLQIESTTRGLLIPRMSTSSRNAIISPATGLMIYNSTTNAFNFYNGSSWTVISTGSSSGTVTSVGLTMPTGFSVANSPITNFGNINVTTSLDGYIKGNGTDFTASTTIPATDLTGTIDDARLSTNVGYTISHAIGGGVNTAASTTEFIINGSTGASATENIRQVPVPIGGTIRQFYIYTSTAQPASGTYILTIRKNGTSNTTAITLAANAPAGVYNTNITSTVSAGDLLSVQLTNNATGASATLRGFSIFITPN